VEHSPSWGANSRSASQDISCHLRNLKIYYHIHKRLSLDPVLRLSNQNFVCISHLSHVCCMTFPSHSCWFHHPYQKLCRFSLCSPASCLLGSDILHSILFSNLYVYFLPLDWEAKFHKHKKWQWNYSFIEVSKLKKLLNWKVNDCKVPWI